MTSTKLKSTSKYPTTLLIKGLNPLGIEITNTLIEEGGYVVIVDEVSHINDDLLDDIKDHKLLSIIDINSLAHIENDLRRVDYIFYFAHEVKSFPKEISSQIFLQESNFLDNALDVAVKYDAKFLLTTSIKAHQIILDSRHDLMEKGADEALLEKLNEIEIQKYSENLVQEYGHKTNLDVRIIRLGEILGKGFNADTQSPYLEMIKSALDTGKITIYGDGLDSDFYIHFLDAAGGLIKSMFSLQTKGKIFSLAIPEEISILSIAYKINEILEDPIEIEFVDRNNKLPPLRLYKPAKSLTSLGWQNKISLDRSVRHTINALKKLQEIQTQKNSHELPKINNQRIEDVVPETKSTSGALSRLIQERKIQEMNRTSGIVSLNSRLKNKYKPKKNKVESLIDYIRYTFDNFKKHFAFLKSLTLRDFIFYSILILLLFAGYIYILSPVLNIGKNFLNIYSEVYAIKPNALELEEVQNNRENTQHIASDIEEIQKRLDEIDYIFTIFGQKKYYNNLQQSLTTQKDYFTGLSIALDGVEPIILSNNSQPKLILRPNSDSLLDIEGSSRDINLNFEQEFSQLQLGIEKLKYTSPSINQSLEVYPDFLKDKLDSKFKDFDQKTQQLIALYQNYEYIAELLGTNKTTSILIILQDNIEQTPGGGNLASFMLITVENGIITEIKTNSFNTLSNKKITIQEYEKESLNLTSSLDFKDSQITPSAASFIQDGHIRSELIERFAEDEFDTDIGLVIWTNLNFLQNFLDEPLIKSDTNFTNTNLTQTLSNLSDSRVERYDLISNIFASVMEREINNQGLLNTLMALSSVVGQNDFLPIDVNTELKGFSEQFYDLSDLNDYVEFGYSSEQISPSENSPSIIVSGNITVKNSEILKSLNFDFKDIQDMESFFMCVPEGSKSFEILNLNTSFYSTNFSSNKICIVIFLENSTEYTINWISPRESLENEYYSFSIIKPSGINVEYNIEFNFESIANISPVLLPEISQANRFVYTGDLKRNLYIRFNNNE